MRLSTTVFSKPCAPCCLARNISAVPPSAILRRIVYRELGLISAIPRSLKLPWGRPLMPRDSLTTFDRRQSGPDGADQSPAHRRRPRREGHTTGPVSYTHLTLPTSDLV